MSYSGSISGDNTHCPFVIHLEKVYNRTPEDEEALEKQLRANREEYKSGRYRYSQPYTPCTKRNGPPFRETYAHITELKMQEDRNKELMELNMHKIIEAALMYEQKIHDLKRKTSGCCK